MPAYQDQIGLVQRLAAEFVAAAGRGDDLGMIVSEALAAAAQSLGATSLLVSGRPGSWEADLLLRLVLGPLDPDDPVVDRKPLGF